MAGYVVGVDVGTTYTSAAVKREGRSRVVPLGATAEQIPSVVFLDADGRWLVGEQAERRGRTEPDRLGREFKRRMGDQTPIRLGGSPHSAAALYARVLAWVLERVTARQPRPPEGLVVTCPANWGGYKRDVLREALDLADTGGEVTVVAEPLAVATHYAATTPAAPGQVVAVYDLGGGTFDAAVVATTEDGHRLLGDTVGVEQLGGIDFDDAVWGHVSAQIASALDELDPTDPATLTALAALRRSCVKAKEALSADTFAAIPVALPNLTTDIRLTRSEFEDLIRPTLMTTVTAMRRALRNANVTAGDITTVVLAGGSSRIPLVGQLLSTELGRPIATDPHPQHTAALGATRLAPAPFPTPTSASPAPSVPPPTASIPVPAAVVPMPVPAPPLAVPAPAPPLPATEPLAPAAPSSEPVAPMSEPVQAEMPGSEQAGPELPVTEPVVLEPTMLMTEPVPPPQRAWWRSRRLAVAGVAVVAAAAIAWSAVALTGPDEPGGAQDVASTASGRSPGDGEQADGSGDDDSLSRSTNAQGEGDQDGDGIADAEDETPGTPGGSGQTDRDGGSPTGTTTPSSPGNGTVRPGTTVPGSPTTTAPGAPTTTAPPAPVTRLWYEVPDFTCALDVSPHPPATVTSIQQVSCSTPHGYEVMGSYDKPPQPWPGIDEVLLEINEYCGAYVSYVRDARPELSLVAAISIPTQQQWEGGLRRLTCSMGLAGGRLMTGHLIP